MYLIKVCERMTTVFHDTDISKILHKFISLCGHGTILQMKQQILTLCFPVLFTEWLTYVTED